MTPEENWHGAAGNEPVMSRGKAVAVGAWVTALVFLAVFAGVVLWMWRVPGR